jgi:hypothetical protein
MTHAGELRFVTSGWSFIPGPEKLEEPTYSTALCEIAIYPPDSIAAAILDFRDTQLLHAAEPPWWDWRARWEEDDRFIVLDMTLFELESGQISWGGSGLITDCLISDVLALWKVLRRPHPCVWLHSPECRVYTEVSFLKEYNDKCNSPSST